MPNNITGITTFPDNGGTLEQAQEIASHASPKTTKLYDRTSDQITLDQEPDGHALRPPTPAMRCVSIPGRWDATSRRRARIAHSNSRGLRSDFSAQSAKKTSNFWPEKRAGPQTVSYILAGPSTEIIRLLVALTATSVTRSPGQGRQRYRHDERENQGTIDRYRASNHKHD